MSQTDILKIIAKNEGVFNQTSTPRLARKVDIIRIPANNEYLRTWQLYLNRACHQSARTVG